MPLTPFGETLALKLAPAKIIALYADHGTHEQFHSEFKSDLDLERLPSGKFDTNYLVLSLAALAYNVLRLIGQTALLDDDAPHETQLIGLRSNEVTDSGCPGNRERFTLKHAHR